ncbi:MAG: hypothetical protein JKY04_01170 [Sneathiella sp.]|nr:hypothetical protein [Sneathiella sp.]
MLNAEGLFSAKNPAGQFSVAKATGQAAVLWAGSNLINAATSTSNTYWHKAYKKELTQKTTENLHKQPLVLLKHCHRYEFEPNEIGRRIL